MLAWGLAYVPSAWLLDAWDPLMAAGARLGLAGALLLVALAALGRGLRPGASPGVVAWLALTQTVIFYAAVFVGIQREGAGLAATLSNTDPIFVAALGALVLGERPRRAQWAGLGLGLMGAAVIVWQGALWPPELSPIGLLVAGGAFAWALGTVVAADRVRGRASALALAGWQMLTGGLVLLSAGAALEGGPGTTGVREIALVVVLAALGSAVPLALFYGALRRAPAGRVSAWFFLIPGIGVLSAWPLLGETPSLRLIVGLVAISAGIWLVVRVPPRDLGRIPQNLTIPGVPARGRPATGREKSS